MYSSLFANHLKIAFRSLKKSKSYSLINILGLALGLAACLLVFSYAKFESSYDLDHPDVDRLYRVNQTAIWNPAGGIMGSTPPPLAARLKENFPEVEAVTRVNTPGSRLVRYKRSETDVLAFNERNVLAADSNFFDFFAFPLKEGDPKSALSGIGKVVISSEIAQKYFANEPALGKVLEFGEERIPVEISGVTRPQADNMHFHIDFLLSMPTNPNVEKFDWSWIWTQVATYAKVAPNTDVQALESKFPAFADQYVKPTFARLGMDYHDFVKDKGGWNFYLQPATDIHLKSANIGNRIGPTGDIAIVKLMRLIAVLILVIGVLNFVNLSTARAGARAKEIGVKKVMGALRSALLSQFLIESIVIASIAMALALGFMQLLQYLIHYFSGIFISTSYIFSPSFVLILIILPIGVGVLAGVYPAIYLSAFKPVQVLKGKLAAGIKGASLRNVLVTAQFTIAIALIAGTVLIYQQLQFIKTKNLGFNKENILIINNAEKLGFQLAAFRDEAVNFPSVTIASMSMDVPGRGTWEDIYMREGSDTKLSVSQIKIDENFFPTLGFKISEGRAFEKSRPADKHHVIINETTARLFDWTNEEALGKKIIYPGYPEDLKVIGVVKDFHFQSLRTDIAPLMFFNIDSKMWGDQRVVTVKYQQKEEQEVLRQLELAWRERTDNVPFEYSFYDEELGRLYEQERSLSGLIAIFSGFSIFIAIIGLLGLLAYSAEQRKKEIGIRKVLGASIGQVFLMLNRQYIQLFLLALILAVPLSWHSMQEWLNSFAYRINVNVFAFVLAGFIVVVLSFLSVSYLSLKAASANPAEVLKDE